MYSVNNVLDTVGDTIGVTIGGTVDAIALGSLVGSSLLGDLDVVVDQRLASNVLDLDALSRLVVDSVTSVAGVDVSIKTSTLTRVLLHDVLVLAERRVHLVHVDIVEEDARAKRGRNGSTKLTITGL